MHDKIIAIITPFFGQAEQLIPLILFAYISHKKIPYTHLLHTKSQQQQRDIHTMVPSNTPDLRNTVSITKNDNNLRTINFLEKLYENYSLQPTKNNKHKMKDLVKKNNKISRLKAPYKLPTIKFPNPTKKTPSLELINRDCDDYLL